MRTEQNRENARNTVVSKAEAVSAPPSIKPQAQIAAETGRSLLSTHRASGEGGCGAHRPKQVGPTDRTTSFFGLGLFLSNQGLRLRIGHRGGTGTEGLGRGQIWLGQSDYPPLGPAR